MRLSAAICSVVAAAVVLSGCSARLDKGDDSDSSKDRNVPSMQLSGWSELHSDPYDIPERALQSYAYAAAAMDRSAPNCGIGWSTLAAIGEVSASNGSADGASVDENGSLSKRLRGLAQANPRNTKPISDTDGGQYDGNATIDLTMGPMQILPSRWEQFATDGDNDGVADPDNFDDATLTAARFLCAAGGDLRQPQGWTAAVTQFNSTPGFVDKVHAKAVLYGR